jgi:lysophospholipase L1-like esterase
MILFRHTVCLMLLAATLRAQTVDALANRQVVVVGDSITQAGGYVTFLTYYLEKLHPQQQFQIYGLGLSSETLSGLSEPGHAGGAFARPCLFERLGRLFERMKPAVVIACYGMNDGIYQPLDPERFAAFKAGVTRLITDCRTAGVAQVVLVTPPIYDIPLDSPGFNYDTVLSAYAAWEVSLSLPSVQVIDLHTAMRQARAKRSEVFSKDKVHPGDDGHLLMAKTILTGFGVQVPDEPVATILTDPLYRLVKDKRTLISDRWMKHIGYSREKVVTPQPLDDTEQRVAKLQAEIDVLRRKP